MRNIFYHSCVEVKNKLWFISQDLYFMNMDIYTQECNLVEVKNIENISFGMVTDKMLTNGSQIFWVEQTGKRLVCYNIEENECKFYNMPSVEYKNWSCFIGLVLFDDKIYIFPRYTPKLIIFDIYNEQFLIEDSFFPKIKEQSFTSMVSVNNIAYFFDGAGKKIIKYVFNNSSYILEELPNKLINIIFVSVLGELVYCLCKNGVYILNLVSNQVEKEYCFDNKNNTFNRLAISQKKIFILPSFDSEILVIDFQTWKCMSLDNIPKDLSFVISKWTNYHGSCENENYIWYAIRSANYYLRIDKKLSLAEWFKLLPPSIDDQKKYYNRIGKTVYRDGEVELPLLPYFAYSQNDKKYIGSIGKKIWKILNNKI